ncbi:MAG: hypothetical protein M3270_08020 [Thermoproteota archaeon]|nr:hypothetical protein [Thermoproteota archaeon]
MKLRKVLLLPESLALPLYAYSTYDSIDITRLFVRQSSKISSINTILVQQIKMDYGRFEPTTSASLFLTHDYYYYP